MQKLKKRKGFTLTELAIVIAVIAILIAVLVPTFISLINKAKESNDSQLAKNMNTTLSTYAAINGDVDTPHEAISALKEDGYLIEKMTPTSEGYSYIWDESTNTVALIDSEFNFVYNTGSSELSQDEEDTTLWAIVSTQSQANTFINSKYAFKYCVVATESVTVDNSFDSYYAEDANVTLTSSTKNAVYAIYTNGGEYTINTTDTTEVYHNGTADLITINKVADQSYHLYGEAKMVVLNDGHLVVEEEATVSILAVTSSSYTITTIDDVDEAIGTIYTTGSSSGETATVTVNKEDYTKAIQSSAISNLTSGISYISTEDELESFIASGAGVAILKADVIIDSALTLNSGNFVSIDLNNHKLTSTWTETNSIKNGSELTISNGELVFNSIQNVYKDDGTIKTYKESIATFSALTGSKITFNNVTATTNGSMLLPQGDAAEVNVIGSTITVTGNYCVGTNAATTANYNVNINLQNSTFTAKEATCDSCAIMINLTGTLNIDGCTINGQRQGVVVRAGTATITDTTITCSVDSDSSYFTTMKSRTTGSWGGGNEVSMGAVVVGNNNSGAYLDDADVTLSGCKLSYTIEGSGYDEYEIALYMIANNVKDGTYYSTTVTVSNNCSFIGKIIEIDTSSDSFVETNNSCSLNVTGLENYSKIATIYTTWVAAAGETPAHWE